VSKNIVISKPPDRTVIVPERTVNVIEINSAVKSGPKGSQILTGDGPPTPSVGLNGDFYIDTSADSLPLYGPKTDGVWPTIAIYSSLSNRFVFEQMVPSSTWEITHTLGGFPSVSVVDSANTVVFGMITYIDEGQIVLTFSAPFSGKAYLT
jgi:hypothetical protein